MRLILDNGSERLIKVARTFVQPIWATDHLIGAVGSPVSPPRAELQWIQAHIEVSPSRWVTAQLFVDSGCQIDGILSKRFIWQHQLSTSSADMAISTVTGEKVTGLSSTRLKVRLSPQVSQVLNFGVLDLPIGDGLIGLGFLNRCRPFSIIGAADGSSMLQITIRHQAYMITSPPKQFPSAPDLPLVNAAIDSSPDAALPDAPPPDLFNHLQLSAGEHVVGVFSVIADPTTNQPTIYAWPTAYDGLEQVAHDFCAHQYWDPTTTESSNDSQGYYHKMGHEPVEHGDATA